MAISLCDSAAETVMPVSLHCKSSRQLTLVGILSSWLWLVTIMVEQYQIQTINKRLQTKAIIIDTGLDRTLLCKLELKVMYMSI